ncbi:DUF4160 domain-containing protein [Photorhabdus sp. P32]|uniref:DUF4160 domain-containing protein n=1 Tax=Photorhabdus sp. P32 TaxID=3117549 RepID=UPI00311B180A
MPTISEFFGILIRMYDDDHNPPHFHAYLNRWSDYHVQSNESGNKARVYLGGDVR